MRLVSYVRVSTSGQEENTSLVDQIAKIAAFSDLYGHEVVAASQDVASGATLERPGLQNALAALDDADGLIIVALDRLSRSAYDTLGLIKSRFDGHQGKALLSVKENLDSSSASGRLLIQVLSAFAEMERSRINERTQGGRRAKHESGGYAWGAPRFGTKAIGGSLVIDHQEQEVIEIIRRHRRSGKSFREIAEFLNTNKISGKRGGLWTGAQVARVLRRERQGCLPVA